MLPVAPHPQLTASVPQSSASTEGTTQGPGLSPTMGSPDPPPSTPKLGAVGAVTPGGTGSSSLPLFLPSH